MAPRGTKFSKKSSRSDRNDLDAPQRRWWFKAGIAVVSPPTRSFQLANNIFQLFYMTCRKDVSVFEPFESTFLPPKWPSPTQFNLERASEVLVFDRHYSFTAQIGLLFLPLIPLSIVFRGVFVLFLYRSMNRRQWHKPMTQSRCDDCFQYNSPFSWFCLLIYLVRPFYCLNSWLSNFCHWMVLCWVLRSRFRVFACFTTSLSL